MNTPRQRAENLLTIHDGTCAVRSDSEVAKEFRVMEKLGLVTITVQAKGLLESETLIIQKTNES